MILSDWDYDIWTMMGLPSRCSCLQTQLFGSHRKTTPVNKIDRVRTAAGKRLNGWDEYSEVTVGDKAQRRRLSEAITIPVRERKRQRETRGLAGQRSGWTSLVEHDGCMWWDTWWKVNPQQNLGPVKPKRRLRACFLESLQQWASKESRQRE